MAKPIENSRNGCALQGALQAVQEIEGFVPILHSTAGCGIQQHLGGNAVSGYQSAGDLGGFSVPSTNVIEKQVVFGGTSRLREQIKNTVKVINGDLYIVLSGCTTELVGDDIPAMTKEAQEQGTPIISVSTPGFKGKAHFGYEALVKTIIQYFAGDSKGADEKIKGLVNIFGIIPKQDVFWKGNLAELKRILEAVGLKVNTLFGLDQGIEQWKDVTKAELNLVFSNWGLGPAKYLEENYKTPYIDFYTIPVGSEDTAALINKVAGRLDIDKTVIDSFIKAEEKQVNHYVKNILDTYFENDFQKEFTLVGDLSTVLGIGRFLVRYFGLIATTVIITDSHDAVSENVIGEIGDIISYDNIEVFFTEDGTEINDIIRNSGSELIIGSSLERDIARELGIPLLAVAFPLIDKVILNKTYAGFRGAVSLIEDLSSEILKSVEEAELEYIKELI
ncbi:MAG: nitrogenase component 1 [Bacillota bacterium]|nr:nitrogenase component 1 [Bacillota bacterium]